MPKTRTGRLSTDILKLYGLAYVIEAVRKAGRGAYMSQLGRELGISDPILVPLLRRVRNLGLIEVDETRGRGPAKHYRATDSFLRPISAGE